MANFERDLRAAINVKIMEDDIARDVWCALANVEWYHPATGESYGCSFRYAGGMIAEMRGEGNFMDWYCCGPDGVVSDFIRRSMKKKGWIYDNTPLICDETGCLEDATNGWLDEDSGIYRHTCFVHRKG